jgi:hypothetical protein
MGAEYQRVIDADDIDDGIVVRVWRIDGELIGEADHPTIEEASSGRLTMAALGSPVSVLDALANAQRLRRALPRFQRIYVQIENVGDWREEWGSLLPAKRSSIVTKPFR